MPDGSKEKDQKQNPPVVNADMLTKKMGKYALVTVVAKRAADIKARQSRESRVEPQENPVTLALADVAEGRVKVVKEKETE